jgi:ferredoxin
MEHGEGKKWYENMMNYAREWLDDEETAKGLHTFMQKTEIISASSNEQIYSVLEENPDRIFELDEQIKRYSMVASHSQIIPIEDVMKVLGIASNPIVRFACGCRRRYLGMENAKYCLVFGRFAEEIVGQYPDYHRGDFDYLTKEETKELIQKWHDKEGHVFTVEAGKLPYIYGICVCEYPVCSVLRRMANWGNYYNFRYKKAEYFAAVDSEKCTGCGKCLARCPFGAMRLKKRTKKVVIDPRRCIGCGQCRVPCSKEAIALRPRHENLLLAEDGEQDVIMFSGQRMIIPRKKVEITVDYEACTDPMNCAKCLHVCPSTVFILKPLYQRQQTGPVVPTKDNWRLMPVHERFCYDCGECVTVCPRGAITIKSKGAVSLKSPAEPPPSP